jgi:hypothetical protein
LEFLDFGTFNSDFSFPISMFHFNSTVVLMALNLLDKLLLSLSILCSHQIPVQLYPINLSLSLLTLVFSIPFLPWVLSFLSLAVFPLVDTPVTHESSLSRPLFESGYYSHHPWIMD